MSEQSTEYQYLIIGAGVAAANAAKGIRAVDADGSIGILGAEGDPPVYRPDLSKTLWLDQDAELDNSELLDDTQNLQLRTGVEVDRIEPDQHRVSLADGSQLDYRKLLIATGASPNTTSLPAGPRVVYYRTVADYRRLHELAKPGTEVVVVGGGYIGSEMASALAQNDVKVTMVIEGGIVQAAMFPPDLAKVVTKAFTEHGVRIVDGVCTGGEATADGVRLELKDGQTLEADAAAIGIGVKPRVQLAEQAGLKIDNGIVVDAQLQTSAADVYAAGDVANYPDKLLGRRRVEHVDNAEKMGEVAGRNMAGEDEAYQNTPFFWSDLFDYGYEAVGETSTRHTMVEDWKGDSLDTGVVYYLDGGSVRGVLLWNVWDSVPKALELIEQTATDPVKDPDSLKGRIPLG